MEKKKASKLAAFGLAGVFGILLLFGTLSSSDFTRGLYCPPDKNNFTTSNWQTFDSLNQNLAWNYRGAFNTSTYPNLDDYLEKFDQYGIESILHKGQWNGTTTYPYWVEYYSCAQYHQFEVTWDSVEAKEQLEVDGSSFYFFEKGEGEENPINSGFWYVTPSSDDADIILSGPRDPCDVHRYCFGDPSYSWPVYFGYEDTTRYYMHRINARADWDAGLDTNTTVFKVYLYYHDTDAIFFLKDSLIVQVRDFDQPLTFQLFDFTAGINADDDCHGIRYDIYWPDSVDLWIDWVEYMDMDRGYYLFVNETSQDTILDKIINECDSLKNEYDVIAGWKQSDEPVRSTFWAHGVVNDALVAEGLGDARTPFRHLGNHRRYDSFVYYGKPPILDFDVYPFEYGNDVGDQDELDYLAEELEAGYQAAQFDSIDFQLTGQAHSQRNKYFIWTHRDPEPSEIYAEGYMALARGAKGITYYKYPSGWNSDTLLYTSKGLVDRFYNHDQEPYASKWQAVHDIFAQLDEIGDELMDMERDTAFCAEYVSENAYQSPVTGVFFEDDDDDYIEVGQFHNASSDTFLILVNRRTDYDRHITVETNLVGNYALRDIYTQEKFISSSGDFEWIPFDSGEGRVFCVEYLN
ncbi:hypothetical protein CEE37_07000 [candidate division LCP-89 bacterium B3_LCP]|uniref:Glycoside hydrolase family 42 N-terminal domain-containing protein n=1 Tax=candidate division LCP-89 bacterium B3_LCP TaxID=2012998 RepID=A0A532V0G6_UNCL8|nr:MAG: hypothetical protein CEE37_07000 [candidate division LCP-89 bacterium B3_LCP]